MPDIFTNYSEALSRVLSGMEWTSAGLLAEELNQARNDRKQVILCGNGGSAGNAMHWANDLIYGAGKTGRGGLRAHALPANAPVVTCLSNDLGYDEVFSAQLRVLGNTGDILVAFSGSGNSPNILRVLEVAREMGIRSWAILGFDGGKALSLADQAIHFPVDDMQIAEDCQMVLGHVITRFLASSTEDC